MMRQYKIDDQPVPGYRIVEHLRREGFGEVWRATGTGGMEVTLNMMALDRERGMREFCSFCLIRDIHHPNLVPIIAFWLKDADGNVLDDACLDLTTANVEPSPATNAQFNGGRPTELVVALGPGQTSLFDRLQECRLAGFEGIPRDELLVYIESSAQAIDFLNSPQHSRDTGPVAIQHCNIKPHNIMIVAGMAQVGSPSLARAVGDEPKSASAVGAIAYGPPELLWDNKPSVSTDQYSLAISYYELRTGHLPFPEDAGAMNVMVAHREGKLTFSLVDDSERAILARATSIRPTDRFQTSMEMVQALRGLK